MKRSIFPGAGMLPEHRRPQTADRPQATTHRGPQAAAWMLVLSCFFLLASCMPSPYYQKNHTIPQNAWSYDYKPAFRVEVSDTTVYYTMYFIIRHTEAYPYANIWLRIRSMQPGDTTGTTSRIEVPLAAPSGQWLGRGMGAVWEHRMIITGQQDSLLFRKAGTYTFSIEQDMRVNPLPEVLQVGLRVEKGAPRQPPATAANP